MVICFLTGSYPSRTPANPSVAVRIESEVPALPISNPLEDIKQNNFNLIFAVGTHGSGAVPGEPED